MSFGREYMPITVVASDYVIIAETPRPRLQLSAVTLLRFQNKPVGFSRRQTADGRRRTVEQSNARSRNAADTIQWKSSMLVAKQQSSLAFQQTDKRGSRRITHTWSDTPTPPHKPVASCMLYWMNSARTSHIPCTEK